MAKKAPAKKSASKSSKSGGKEASRPKKSKSEKSGPAPRTQKKPASKPTAKTAASKPAGKAAVKPVAKGKDKGVGAAAGKAGGKPAAKPGAKQPAKVVVKAGAKAPEAPSAGPADPKGGRKGITIVSNKPKRPSTKPPRIEIPKTEPLLGPGSPFRKPLIASGPGAARRSIEIDAESLAKIKSPFNKKELQKFREILLKKRADLVGDVSDLESEALLGRSGSLSALPQHIAEQGSETYEQSLSLNLAAEDRRLIREIDAALQRIDKGTFGICEMTGKPINRERLEELPWTRFSIDAAREMERRIATGQAPPSALGR